MYNPLTANLVDFHTASMGTSNAMKHQYLDVNHGPTALPEFGHYHEFKPEEIVSLGFHKLLILLEHQGNITHQIDAVEEGFRLCMYEAWGQHGFTADQVASLKEACIRISDKLYKVAESDYATAGATGHVTSDENVAWRWRELAEGLKATK